MSGCNDSKACAGVSRRDALKAGAAVAGSVLLFTLAPAQAKEEKYGAVGLPEGYNPDAHYYGYAIDITKCIGCGRCADACKTENDVSRTDPNYRTWIERYVVRKTEVAKGQTKGQMDVEVESPEGGINGFEPVKSPDTVAKSFFVPKMCSHCERSPCEQVCPVGATFFSPDGVVLIDKTYCIGCGYCIQACPYGCRYFDLKTETAGKCTLCYHRITRGLKPACATVCPTGARVFGDLKQEDGELVTFIKTHNVQILKPQMNTRPKLVYNGLDREVR